MTDRFLTVPIDGETAPVELRQGESGWLFLCRVHVNGAPLAGPATTDFEPELAGRNADGSTWTVTGEWLTYEEQEYAAFACTPEMTAVPGRGEAELRLWELVPETVTEEIAFTEKAYVNTGSTAVGKKIPTSGEGADEVPATTANNGYLYAADRCRSGKDSYFLTGTGANAPRLWAFTDEDFILRSKADANASSDGSVPQTAAQDGWFIANVKKANDHGLIKQWERKVRGGSIATARPIPVFVQKTPIEVTT